MVARGRDGYEMGKSMESVRSVEGQRDDGKGSVWKRGRERGKWIHTAALTPLGQGQVSHKCIP